MTEQFIEKAKLKHGDKYDYSKVVYINCKLKVIIICENHGEFNMTPDSHINGKQGCKICNKINANKKLKLTQTQFLEKSIKKHHDKYDYSKAQYNSYYEHVIIICKKHG